MANHVKKYTEYLIHGCISFFLFSFVRWLTSVTAIHQGTAQPHHSRHNRANSWHNRANSRHNRKSFNTAEVKRNGRDSQLKMAEVMGDDLDDEEGLIRGIFHE